jgi:hypothetical protein
MAHIVIESPAYKTLEALQAFVNELAAKREQNNLSKLLAQIFQGNQQAGNTETSWYQPPQQQEAPDGISKAYMPKTQQGYTIDPNMLNASEDSLVRLYGSAMAPASPPSSTTPSTQKQFDFYNAMQTLFNDPTAVARAGGIGKILPVVQSLAGLDQAERQLALDEMYKKRSLDQTDRSLDYQEKSGERAYQLQKENSEFDRAYKQAQLELEKKKTEVEMMYKNGLLSAKQAEMYLKQIEFAQKQQKAQYELLKARGDAVSANVGAEKSIYDFEQQKKIDDLAKNGMLKLQQRNTTGAYVSLTPAELVAIRIKYKPQDFGLESWDEFDQKYGKVSAAGAFINSVLGNKSQTANE